MLTTDEPAKCNYDTTDKAFGQMANTLSTNLQAVHSTKINSGLTNGATYKYYVRCQDAALNSDTTSTVAQFTIASVDREAPEVVKNFRVVSKTRTSVTLAWNASRDVNDANRVGYQIYQDGKIVVGTTLTTWTASSLSPNTSYKFEIVAYDASPARNRAAIAGLPGTVTTMP